MVSSAKIHLLCLPPPPPHPHLRSQMSISTHITLFCKIWGGGGANNMHYGRCASGVFTILRGANKLYCGQGMCNWWIEGSPWASSAQVRSVGASDNFCSSHSSHRRQLQMETSALRAHALNKCPSRKTSQNTISPSLALLEHHFLSLP